MKKTLLLFIAILTIAVTNAQSVEDLFTESNINYKVTAVGTPNEVEIQLSPSATGALVIPANITDSATGFEYDVTSIIEYAFQSNTNITSLVIEGDLSVGNYAFNLCTNMTSADLSSIVASAIGNNSFRDNTKLTSIDLSSLTASAGNNTFNGCSLLTDITLGSGALGLYTFENCIALETVDISGVTGSVGNSAFRGCSSLVTVDIRNASFIDQQVFKNCTSLENVYLHNVPSIATHTGTSSIFSGANNLVNVQMGSVTTDIPNSMFANRSSLTTIDVGSTTSIGQYAFQNTSALTTTDFTSVVTINRNAFQASGLTTVSLPVATTFKLFSFYQCSNLTSISMPAVISIEKAAFNATGLLSVRLPATLTTIEQVSYNTFKNSSNLAKIFIEGTFASINSPGGLTYGGASDTLVGTIFEGIAASPVLIVTSGELASFQAADVWKDFSVTTAAILSTDSQEEEESLNSYPNPVVDRLNIISTRVASVEIYSVSGANIANQIINNGSVDMSTLDSGIYFIKCIDTDGNPIATLKTIKK